MLTTVCRLYFYTMWILGALIIELASNLGMLLCSSNDLRALPLERNHLAVER